MRSSTFKGIGFSHILATYSALVSTSAGASTKAFSESSRSALAFSAAICSNPSPRTANRRCSGTEYPLIIYRASKKYASSISGRTLSSAAYRAKPRLVRSLKRFMGRAFCGASGSEFRHSIRPPSIITRYKFSSSNRFKHFLPSALKFSNCEAVSRKERRVRCIRSPFAARKVISRGARSSSRALRSSFFFLLE